MPAPIVLVSADHAEVLEKQFWRCTREYDVRVASSAEEAELLVTGLRDAGNPPCLLVADLGGGPHTVCTDGGDVHARAVVIATGVTYRRLSAGSVDDYVGNGVHYGAAMSTASSSSSGPSRTPSGSPARSPWTTGASSAPAASGEGAAVVPLVHAWLS